MRESKGGRPQPTLVLFDGKLRAKLLKKGLIAVASFVIQKTLSRIVGMAFGVEQGRVRTEFRTPPLIKFED